MGTVLRFRPTRLTFRSAPPEEASINVFFRARGVAAERLEKMKRVDAWLNRACELMVLFEAWLEHTEVEKTQKVAKNFLENLKKGSSMGLLHDRVEGGKLIGANGAENAAITQAKFGVFAYGGKAAPSPGLVLTLQVENEDATEQFWSCGKLSEWEGIKNGKYMKPVREGGGIAKSSNLGMLLESISAAGADDLLVDIDSKEDISGLIGLRAFWIRKTVERRGLDKPEQTVLVVQSIISRPTAEMAQSAPAQSAPAETSIEDWLLAAVTTQLANGPVKRVSLLPKLFQAAPKEKVAQPEQVKAAFTEAWLKSHPEMFVLDGGMLSLVD